MEQNQTTCCTCQCIRQDLAQPVTEIEATVRRGPVELADDELTLVIGGLAAGCVSAASASPNLLCC